MAQLTPESEELLRQRLATVQDLLSEASDDDEDKDDEAEDKKKEDDEAEVKEAKEDDEDEDSEDHEAKEKKDGEEEEDDDEDEDEMDEAAHLAAIFGSEELSEAFKERAAVVFKTAVRAHVDRVLGEERVALQAEFDAARETLIKEAKEATEAELRLGLDSYLSEAVKAFVEENKPTFEREVRLELLESFFGGMKDLFEQHDILMPVAEEPMVKTLAKRVNEAENELAKVSGEFAALSKELTEAQQMLKFSELTEGLSLSQKEKLKALLEGRTFEKLEHFEKEVGILSEAYFKGNTVKEEETILHEAKEETNEPSETVTAYVEALGRMVRGQR